MHKHGATGGQVGLWREALDMKSSLHDKEKQLRDMLPRWPNRSVAHPPINS